MQHGAGGRLGFRAARRGERDPHAERGARPRRGGTRLDGRRQRDRERRGRAPGRRSRPGRRPVRRCGAGRGRRRGDDERPDAHAGSARRRAEAHGRPQREQRAFLAVGADEQGPVRSTGADAWLRAIGPHRHPPAERPDGPDRRQEAEPRRRHHEPDERRGLQPGPRGAGALGARARPVRCRAGRAGGGASATRNRTLIAAVVGGVPSSSPRAWAPPPHDRAIGARATPADGAAASASAAAIASAPTASGARAVAAGGAPSAASAAPRSHRHGGSDRSGGSRSRSSRRRPHPRPHPQRLPQCRGVRWQRRHALRPRRPSPRHRS